MTALAKSKSRDYEAGTEHVMSNDGVLTNTNIYEGGTVSMTSAGYCKPYAGTDTVFMGFAAEDVLNNPGASGAKTVRLRAKGIVKRLAVSGVVVGTTLPGASVYAATDDDTFNLTSTSNLLIGKVHRVIAAGIADVAFRATSLA